MYIDLTKIGPHSLEKGAKYKLLKTHTDSMKLNRFEPPHEFTYVGRDGIGNYQDEERFVDADGHNLNFCVTLEDWKEFLERIEQ